MSDTPDSSPSVARRLARLAFDTAPRAIIAALLVISVLINFANVIGRYLFGHSIYWTEEVLVFLLLWSVFIGIVAVTYNGAHLSMDVLSQRLIGRPRRILNGAAVLTLIACSTVVAVESFQVVLVLARTGQVSVAANVPMVIPHAAILVGFALVAIAALIRFRAYLAGRFE
jgi:TRAP-type C4-dicarboxylate transport system permease small subunit